jgi:hypothetical protein
VSFCAFGKNWLLAVVGVSTTHLWMVLHSVGVRDLYLWNWLRNFDFVSGAPDAREAVFYTPESGTLGNLTHRLTVNATASSVTKWFSKLFLGWLENSFSCIHLKPNFFSWNCCDGLQDIAFFDVEAVGALTSRLGSDCQQVSRIIGNDLNIMFRNALQVLHHVLSLNMGQDDV